jgi:dienelactone hydrolase
MPDDWVPWKIIASNTYGHYEQHTLDIEAWVAKTTLPVSSARIDHIPVIWVAPESTPLPSRLVIWLPYFTGTKEQMLPSLQQLAAAGFVALSYDPWQHGERGSESAEQLVARVFGNFRRHMWPILGQTTIDALRVIDWAIENLGVLPPVRIGGISMGGDIAVAIAGLDTRVECVAAIAGTPDWLRPGMTDPFQPGTLLPPGEADGYARFFYDQLNPITHLTSYAHCPAITFECGEMDTHVPPDGALRLQEALKETYQARPERLRVNLHPDTGHDSSNPDIWQGCLEWFKRF